MRNVALAALAAAFTVMAAPASGAPASPCAPVATLHLYGNDRFDMQLPRGVIVQGPGNTPVSFYLDLNAVPGLTSRLQYDHVSGMFHIDNGFMTGSGADWTIYPATQACRAVASRGRTQTLRGTSPSDPGTLPQNSITTEPSR